MKSNFLKYEMKEKNKVMNDYPIAKTHDNSNNEEKKENIRNVKMNRELYIPLKYHHSKQTKHYQCYVTIAIQKRQQCKHPHLIRIKNVDDTYTSFKRKKQTLIPDDSIEKHINSWGIDNKKNDPQIDSGSEKTVLCHDY